MLWGAVIAAAGQGTRFGQPKQLVPLAGKPLVSWSLRTFARMPEIAELVIVAESQEAARVREVAGEYSGTKPFTVVPGGERRQDSVRRGLEALSENIAAVCIHDAARPLVTSADIRNGMGALEAGRGALLGVPVRDTIKVVNQETRQVTRTLDRDELWAAQTPQFAMRADLRRAYIEAARIGLRATDDMTLLERIGLDVVIVPGSNENFKITVPEDLRLAEELLAKRDDTLEEEEEILLLEAFVAQNSVDRVRGEIERRGGTIDGIDRDLPTAVAIRAFVPSAQLHGFAEQFQELTGGKAAFTTHFSHVATKTAHPGS